MKQLLFLAKFIDEETSFQILQEFVVKYKEDKTEENKSILMIAVQLFVICNIGVPIDKIEDDLKGVERFLDLRNFTKS